MLEVGLSGDKLGVEGVELVRILVRPHRKTGDTSDELEGVLELFLDVSRTSECGYARGLREVGEYLLDLDESGGWSSGLSRCLVKVFGRG